MLLTIGRNINKINIDGVEVSELGYLNDHEMINNAYSAADVFITPSLAESFGNTVLESLLCGTPVIGFPVGGVKEQIMFAVLFLCGVQMIALIKIFAWQMIHRNGIKREIKRLEIRIANLTNKVSGEKTE